MKFELNDLIAPLGTVAARADDDIWMAYFAAGKLQARTRWHVSVRGEVAVVPLQGAIIRGMGHYGTDPDDFRRAVNASAANPKIKQILLYVDSPGGALPGVELAAQAVYAARQVKPVVAITSDYNCSAALWISSQASRVYSTRDGWTGSHGVFRQHVSFAKAAEQAGVECTFIHAGKFKVEGNLWQPLSEEAKSHWQQCVNDTFAEFTAALARGREKSTEHIMQHFGQGRSLTAQQALSAGMIDEIVESDQVLAKMHGSSGLVAVNEQLTRDLLCEISGDSPQQSSTSSRQIYYQKKLKVREREIAS